MPRPTPLLLTNCHLLAGRKEGRIALLLNDGRITAMGEAKSLLQRVKNGGNAPLETLDVGGRTVIPGFRDGHFHFFQFGLFQARPSLAGARSLVAALEQLQEACRALPAGETLFAEAWDEDGWPEGRGLSGDDLDRIAKDRPIVARRVCGHVAALNRAAQERLDHRHGEAGAGVFREGLVMDLDESFFPSPAAAGRALTAATEFCLARGIIAATDFLRPRAARAYSELWAQQQYPLRIDAYAVAACFAQPGLIESLPRSGTFALRGWKLFLDGSLGGRTAALHQPYEDAPNACGELLYSDDELDVLLRQIDDRDEAAAVHAIGDRAIHQALDAFERLAAERPQRAPFTPRGHRIEHVELPAAGDFERFVRLGIRPCMQPNFVGRWGQPGGLYERALGPDRLAAMNPLRTAAEADCGLFFGSDGMPTSPLYGIRSAVQHPVEEQRLSPREAVQLYTEAVADALADDPLAARLEPGAPADLVVLPGGEETLRDPALDDGPDEVALTILGGRVRHRSLPT